MFRLPARHTLTFTSVPIRVAVNPHSLHRFDVFRGLTAAAGQRAHTESAVRR